MVNKQIYIFENKMKGIGRHEEEHAILFKAKLLTCVFIKFHEMTCFYLFLNSNY